jgi:hypothetical protein
MGVMGVVRVTIFAPDHPAVHSSFSGAAAERVVPSSPTTSTKEASDT